jgi:hypothetical protein
VVVEEDWWMLDVDVVVGSGSVEVEVEAERGCCNFEVCVDVELGFWGTRRRNGDKTGKRTNDDKLDVANQLKKQFYTH